MVVSKLPSCRHHLNPKLKLKHLHSHPPNSTIPRVLPSSVSELRTAPISKGEPMYTLGTIYDTTVYTKTHTRASRPLTPLAHPHTILIQSKHHRCLRSRL
ncbi:hypothetical protein T440DRAFT_463268 [Plenodomus tracheiphilus IPT5]|uniref:Uncharacterized protein n=1 Tax=Plenodomus tracheiphilus IPT5 TaxID=1408161 RepID=A0A6A7BKV4_9PLEO|nr:hypothetical protein T440DRAFT_463268 [Plenodomus tracheiphilus IPT5]